MMEITFETLPKAVAGLYERLDTIERLLKENHGEKGSEPEHILTIQEVSQLLGVTVPTIYGYVHRGNIPVFKRGSRLRFSKTEVMNWLKAARKKTMKEIINEADAYVRKNHEK